MTCVKNESKLHVLVIPIAVVPRERLPSDLVGGGSAGHVDKRPLGSPVQISHVQRAERVPH